MAWPTFFLWLRVRRLAIQGTAQNGQVSFVKPRNPLTFNWQFGASFEVFYRFFDEAGIERTGKMVCDNAWLVNQLRVGSPVVVAYDPQKPEKNVFLEPFAA